MKPATVLLALLAATATNAFAAGSPAAPPVSHPGAVLTPLGTSADYAQIEVGSNAPDFSFEPVTGGASRLRDVLAQGAALVVIGAGDARIGELERERPRLFEMGVVTVVVLDFKPGHCRDIARRLGYRGVVAPDPQRVIAAQFNALEAVTRASAPAWFIVDREGRVRSLGRFEWPSESWTGIAQGALGLASGNVNTAIPRKR